MKLKGMQIGAGLVALLSVLTALMCMIPLASSASASVGTLPGPPHTEPVSLPASATGCAPDWSVVPSPDVITATNYLLGVDAISSSDIWAVGHYNPTRGIETLIEHWDGSAWSIVPSPNPGTPDKYAFILGGVSAVSTNDVWAVGEAFLSGSGWQTLIEHWDGTAWSVVPSPSPGTYGNLLNAVSAVTANDVWAVGVYEVTGSQTLIEHWDGNIWSVVPGPSIGESVSELYAVSGVSANDVWAVGKFGVSGSGWEQTLIEHWDGNIWSVVPSPSPGTYGNLLNAVSWVSANDVWAVGHYQPTGSIRQTLIEHWDGNTWSVVLSPDPGTVSNSLTGVSAISANDVWAVGLFSDSNVDKTLIEHWDGNTWSVVSSPNPGTTGNNLAGVSAVSAVDVWAVGYIDNAAGHTLVERYNPCPPTPSTTPTVPVATATSMATTAPSTTPRVTSTETPTVTATMTASTISSATATECMLVFTDVPEGSTFYPFVRCLACRGIVSGYPDGTFRPNNNVTRGQLAKIVSNAAGFHEPSGIPLFEDVAPGSTFYDFVQRLASRAYINGYPCGGVGEPCGGGSLPYFRPNNSATRAQISKIVSNAAGYTEPAGVQLFEDVAPGSTFYDFIQRLASRNIINGYPCAGWGEPCGLYSLPYFRPNNNATRGQTSKIVANSFYPDCQSTLR
ncbi:MAG: S-layer homology domain-containing protein [Chloroflexota bacterium]